jgi:hypothetical protein
MGVEKSAAQAAQASARGIVIRTALVELDEAVMRVTGNAVSDFTSVGRVGSDLASS